MYIHFEEFIRMRNLLDWLGTRLAQITLTYLSIYECVVCVQVVQTVCTQVNSF